MIKLERCTKTFGDCTAGYKVTLTKEYTVREFVNEVVSNEKEWGYIGIKKEGEPWFSRGNPNCEYRWGKLLSNLPEEYLDKKIMNVSATGGWSNMDYSIEL